MTKVVKKFNFVKFISFILVLIIILSGIIVGTTLLVKKSNYKKTYDYKLISLGYSEEETKTIKEKLTEKEIDKILTLDPSSSIVSLISQKYFIFSNLDKYIDYMDKNKEEDFYKIVAIINTEADIDWIDEEKKTNIEDGDLLLVNRLYGLESDYVPEEIVSIPVKYAFSGKKIRKSILDKITDLMDTARENGYSFIVADGYRSYKDQKEIYDNYVDLNGRNEADKIVARPGHSEYQTGLSFDLEPYNKVYDTPKMSEEYIWLQNNAYKYGFIFRFDSEKEYLTGFKASTWRLRYVGEEAAKIIHDENLCFEEYYYYYVRGDKK